MLVDAMRHHMGEIGTAYRTPSATVASAPARRELTNRAIASSTPPWSRSPACASWWPTPGAPHRQGQHQVRRPRVSHVTDATTTGAWSSPPSCSRPTPEGETAALVKVHRLDLTTIIPRGGGTGYTGGAIPLKLAQRRHQHRSSEAMTEVEMVRHRARQLPCVWTEAGVVTQRVADAASRGSYVFAIITIHPRPRASALNITP